MASPKQSRKQAGEGTVAEPGSGGERPGFEESLGRLEAIVESMEEGELSLDELVRKYEEGTKLVRECTATLESAERRIEVITEGADGGPRPDGLDMAAGEAGRREDTGDE